MSKIKKVIDLGKLKCIPKGTKVLGGKELGEKVRIESGIDALVGIITSVSSDSNTSASKVDNDIIKIKIPKEVESMEESFLETFLKNVVIRLNEEGFYKKFTFKSQGNYRSQNDLKRGIERIISRHNNLAY